jgi:hypothetical protein
MSQFAYDKPKKRARIELLSWIAQFDLRTRHSDGTTYAGLKDGGFRFADICRPGDLVALQSAPTSKWYLAWCHEVKVEKYGNIYVLESIEDGEICNWSNVGIRVYDRAEVDRFPSWRWTDAQFAFKDRWNNVCYKEKNAYITLPTGPDFGEGFSVTLGTRTRFSMDEHRPERTFHDWRRVTKKMMGAFYDECVSEREASRQPKSPRP